MRLHYCIKSYDRKASMALISRLFQRLTLVYLLALLWPLASFADAIISQRAWLEDPTTQLSFLQAKTKKIESYEGVLSKGYTDSVFWIRLRIEPTSEKNLVLRIRPRSLTALSFTIRRYWRTRNYNPDSAVIAISRQSQIISL